MSKNRRTIQELFGKIVSDTCTDQEAALFFELIRELPGDDILMAELESRWDKLAIDRGLGEDRGLNIREKLMSQIHENKQVNLSGSSSGALANVPVRMEEQSVAMEPQLYNDASRPVHRIHFLKTAWFRYAAAVLIMIGIGAYFWNTRQIEKSVKTQPISISLKNNAAPGSSKAILILSDGSKIILDSAANGQLAQQGASTVKKNGDGQITYVTENTGADQPVVFNTMNTPRGGQYQLTLPDGSQVWLNAGSSITYPTVFTGTSREVSVTGETYFEVKENAALPFKVKVSGALIEVLGTHFNVNAYNDEPAVKTTLLEGAVKVVKGNNQQILKPGQQAQFSDESNMINLINDADTDEAIAWKNGAFDFKDQDIGTVMRQIGRWYNMEIVYEGKKPDVHILSMISRNTDLNTVLKSLELIGLHFKVEGSLTKEQPGKIIVLQ